MDAFFGSGGWYADEQPEPARLGGAGLDEFLKSTGLAAVLEQRKMLEVCSFLYHFANVAVR